MINQGNKRLTGSCPRASLFVRNRQKGYKNNAWACATGGADDVEGAGVGRQREPGSRTISQ